MFNIQRSCSFKYFEATIITVAQMFDKAGWDIAVS